MYRCLILMLLVSIFEFFGCKNSKSDQSELDQTEQVHDHTEESDVQSTTSTESSQWDFETPVVFEEIFQEKTIQSMAELKTKFEEGLGAKAGSNLDQLYRLHANRLRTDIVNQTPFTINYPYDKSELFIDSIALEKLPFLTNACGFMIGDNVEVHYACFTQRNDFFKYLLSETNFNDVIRDFVIEYNKVGTITPMMQRNVVLDNPDKLDFKRFPDQLFYAMFHILLNEEHVTTKAVGARMAQQQKAGAQ